MRIGIQTSHIYSMYGGGYQAVKWHVLALGKLGHQVTVFTTNIPSKDVLDNWFDKVSLRTYYPGVEKDFDAFLGIDHFSWALPLAKKNYAHLFFPQEQLPPPPPGVKIYSNSAYTARHAVAKWGVPVEPMYIPIDQGFYCANKQGIILHISRFSEPSPFADKGHRQMIQAWKMIQKQLPGWRLVLMGGVDRGNEFYMEELMRLARGYEIEFRPSQSPKALRDLLSVASIYWHATGVSLSNVPSAQEHMGIAPIEAQASGCVPIVYNSGGMPEVVLNRQTGLLFDNIMDLPHVTLDLLNRMRDWSAMSQAGQIWAHEWQDFDAFVGRIDDMLHDRPITPMKPLRMELKYGPDQVTCVIPTFNSALLPKLLDSLKETAPDMKVLIINNGSPLSNLRVDHNVTVYEAGENLGFAGAHKLASGMVTTPFVLMMNDDMLAHNPGWLEQLLLLMNNDTVGVVGPKLLFGNGSLQFAGGIVDWNREDVGSHKNYGGMDGVDVSTPLECDFITGAALLCRRELYNIRDYLLDGLNMEDVDICFMAREKKFKIVYQPASVLTHFEGETKKRTPESQEKVTRNRVEFRKKWMK